jgi:hypothetical protein
MMPTTNPNRDSRFIERRQSTPDEILAPATFRWLAALPPKARPRLLPTQFARIANTLASKWSVRSDCLAYLDDLLIDKRGDRRGFPLALVLELAALKNYFETALHPAPQTVWGQIAERRRDR